MEDTNVCPTGGTALPENCRNCERWNGRRSNGARPICWVGMAKTEPGDHCKYWEPIRSQE